MVRWQTGIPALIASVLLTACGTAMPAGSGLTVQMDGNPGNPYGGRAQPNVMTLPNGLIPPPGSQYPQQYPPQQPTGPAVPPASQFPQQYPPQQPNGPVVPPASQFPQQYPPLQPGGPVGGLGLDSCIQHYMNSINFIMAPTEAQLAGLREQARRHCLSGASRNAGNIPF